MVQEFEIADVPLFCPLGAFPDPYSGPYSDSPNLPFRLPAYLTSSRPIVPTYIPTRSGPCSVFNVSYLAAGWSVLSR
jgi:hypothetical protein